jgi:hypothetical protein
MTTARLFGWWRVGEAAVRCLTEPRIDVVASDRQVEQLFRGSALFAAGRATSDAFSRAWTDSRVRALVASIGHKLVPARRSASVRVAGLMAVTASITALGLQTLKPVPAGPLSWIVPALGIAAGAVVAWAARPIADALEDRTR